MARKSSGVISAVIALPEGEKLKLPVSASCASSAAASSRDKVRPAPLAPERAITPGDLLAPHIGERHRSRKGLQQVEQQPVHGVGGHVGGRAPHFDGPFAAEVDVEAQGSELHGILLQQGVFVARKDQPFGEQQLLAHDEPLPSIRR